VSDLLLAETPTGESSEVDRIWPAAQAAAAWAHDLHNDLERGQLRSGAELTSRIASWLRVQAVGRESVCVVEPRMSTFAGEWNAGAAAAGLAPVRLRRADGSTDVMPPCDATAMAIEPVTAESVTPGWQHRVEVWIVDRGEDLARAAIRALQR
jgi:hypothetical protein